MAEEPNSTTAYDEKISKQQERHKNLESNLLKSKIAYYKFLTCKVIIDILKSIVS